jgi:hypothetical protein
MRVTIALCDASGSELVTADEDVRSTGVYTATLALPVSSGGASGTYFLRITARDLRSGAVTQALRPLTILP